MSPLYKPYAYLTLAMIIVGSSAVAGSQMVVQLPVHLASVLRFGLAAMLLVPLLYWREGGFPRLRWKTHLLLFLQAVCGSFLFTLLFLKGLQLTSPASAGIITSTTPACMALIAWGIFHERPRRRVLAGVACSMGGILLVHLAEMPGQGGGSALYAGLYGNLLVMGAVFFESMFLLLRKSVREPLSSLAASTLVSLYGGLLFMPLGLVEAYSFPFAELRPETWLAVGYYAFVVTVLAYLFWFAGIVRVPAGVAGVFTGVMPVSAVVLSGVVLGESIGLLQLSGCLGVVLGIYFISGAGAGGNSRRQVFRGMLRHTSGLFAAVAKEFFHFLRSERR